MAYYNHHTRIIRVLSDMIRYKMNEVLISEDRNCNLREDIMKDMVKFFMQTSIPEEVRLLQANKLPTKRRNFNNVYNITCSKEKFTFISQASF